MALQNTHYGAAEIARMLASCRSIYFIGIGGINMSSLAHLTRRAGYRTGGSDRVRSALVCRLEDEGVEIFLGHDAANLEGYDAVVYTVAVGADNPEYLEACRRGIPCISRSDYMGYLMTDYTVRIGISGSHGKSTCTSMCAEVLLRADKNPTVLSGAELALMKGAYFVGGEELFVFEACEYMDSFLDFNPTVSVLLNVELDHVDYFADLAQMRRSFGRFASLAGKNGFAVANADDENVKIALDGFEGEILDFGIQNEAARFRAMDIRENGGRYSFRVLRDGEEFCRIALSVSGYHNIYNALACTAVCSLCGLSGEEIARGLSAFGGASRRMEYKGELGGAAVYDDYAHHPTEIRTTLEGAKRMAKGRLFCVFQSHTYSRTHALFDEFADALRIADRVIVTDIYAARETDTLGVSPEGLAEKIGTHASACHGFSAAAERLAAELREGDVAIVMGAGDVFKVFDYLDLKKGERA